MESRAPAGRALFGGRPSGHEFEDDLRLLRRAVRRQQLPLIGDLEQQLALPEIQGLYGKRLGFLGALMAFVGSHDLTTTPSHKKGPNGRFARWDQMS